VQLFPGSFLFPKAEKDGYTAAMPVREKRRFTFGDIIVRPEDVRTLAKIVVEASNSQQQAESRTILSFIIQVEGGGMFESDSPELFGEDGHLDSKQVYRVGIELVDYKTGARIQVSLRQGGPAAYSNYVDVTGKDSMWVNGTTTKLEEAILGFEKQTTWPRKWEPLLVIVGALGIGRAWVVFQLFLEKHVFHVLPLTPRPHWTDVLEPFIPLIQWALIFLSGLLPSIYLTHKLLELWPSVEFRMGREWNQLTRRRKARLWAFFSIAVLPLLLSLLYDLLKEIWGRLWKPKTTPNTSSEKIGSQRSYAADDSPVVV